jgi:AICAR transformylase/IMP cyclohydrolase PurH
MTTVVVDPDDYTSLGATLGEHGGAVPVTVRRALSRKAFGHTAAYGPAIAQYLARHDDTGNAMAAADVIPGRREGPASPS